MSKAPNVKWTREHLLMALNLYCKLPFGKLHSGDPVIIDMARKYGPDGRQSCDEALQFRIA